ncbi:MAG: NIPSNAP family protein [Chloroflexota bacterium]|nr:NIPSNAP family protein [Chloroflexota bacterium]
MDKIIEVRSYNLSPGSRDHFHSLMLGQSLPMLQRWNVDVVAFGPSPHDETSYYLIRAYKSLADREQSQDAFYGSAEWRDGPREAILACIESLTSVVLPVDEQTLQGLRSRRGETAGTGSDYKSA